MEADSTVKGRLDFINGEMCATPNPCFKAFADNIYSTRLEGVIKSSQATMEKKKAEIIQIQAAAQAAAGAAGAEGAQ